MAEKTTAKKTARKPRTRKPAPPKEINIAEVNVKHLKELTEAITECMKDPGVERYLTAVRERESFILHLSKMAGLEGERDWTLNIQEGKFVKQA